MRFLSSERKGFTLVQTLVVIAIIGVLSAVVLASVQSARKSARDKQRKSDLQQIVLAMRLYKDKNEPAYSYQVLGTGSGNLGKGWFSYKDPLADPPTTYSTSIAQGLVNAGLLTDIIHDPLVPPNVTVASGRHGYMLYEAAYTAPQLIFSTGYCVFASLESPSSADSQAFTDAKAGLNTNQQNAVSNNGMNYGVCK